ncbi:aldose 1-epimerase family protein [Robinsoniella peoriensis]|uniref:Aldose 1-epimerase n=1 Tax=Robinsoniella peoriensis TaxID=180332 RepID=A0A4V6HS63_9FIRM|nr:aldose 1-epimerase family protein [Robinsoniella peoriensis]MDU7030506.1 aldose 1-epimerase family protein [Clostridiales bacterium]TLD01698.1 Aldose 1-epimerase [Robinsoniella peoriensis]
MSETRVLENEALRIEVNDFGAELARVYDKNAGREVLWNADPAYWNRHAPVLFPFVGALQDEQYQYNNKSYRMGQHGFARDSVFTLEEQQSTLICHKLTWTEDSFKKYPFKFSLYITHILSGNVIKVCWKVVNEQEEAMYFGIGAHPAFLAPVKAEEKQEDYYLNLYTDKENYTCLRINEKGLALTETPETFVAQGGFCPLKKDLFKDGVWIFENAQLQKAGLALPDKTPYIEINCEGFPYVGIWTKPGAPFVCLEPWYGRTDDAGFKGKIQDKAGIQKLNAGETFEADYTITVCH